MIEYALMAGFVAVAAGAVFPPVGNTISAIFSAGGLVTEGCIHAGELVLRWSRESHSANHRWPSSLFKRGVHRARWEHAP
jgi:hypothetical protein